MLPVLAVLAAAVLFGTTGTAQALGPSEASPLSIGVVRLVIGGSALALIAVLIGWRAQRRGEPRRRLTLRAGGLMTLAGVCMTVYQPLFFTGTERNGVAVGTVIALGSAPVIAGFIEWALTSRRPTAVWALATALAVIGVSLLAWGGGAGSGGADVWGILSSLGAGTAFAVFTNAQRMLIVDGWSPFTVIGGMGAVSAALSLALVPFVDLSWLAAPGGWAMGLWLALGTTAAAYVLFIVGLRRLTAATTATLTLAEPLTASLLGILVLGERLAPLSLVGLAVLTVALMVLAWSSRSPRNPHAVPLEA